MLFHKNVTYGIKTVIYLAGLEKNLIRTSGEISSELHIPKEFTSKVLQSLTKSGIVVSKKGKGGGFYLGKDPEKIRLVDIILALDSSASIDFCLFGFRDCNLGRKCPLHDSMENLRNHFYDFIYNNSLKDLNTERTFQF